MSKCPQCSKKHKTRPEGLPCVNKAYDDYVDAVLAYRQDTDPDKSESAILSAMDKQGKTWSYFLGLPF